MPTTSTAVKSTATVNAPAEVRPRVSTLPKILRESKTLTQKVTRDQAETILYPSNNGHSLSEIYGGLVEKEPKGSGASLDGNNE